MGGVDTARRRLCQRAPRVIDADLSTEERQALKRGAETLRNAVARIQGAGVAA
jgi:hypothetical protein